MTHTHTVVRVALAGCGTVGGGLIDLLDAYARDVHWRSGTRYELVAILVRDAQRPRSASVPRHLLTDDIETFLATPADVVVEAIGGTTTAHRIVREALARGRRVVTANKALLRVAGPSLAALAARHKWQGAALDFEAAVAGGVPITRLFREALVGQGLTEIRGVLNGTTNFILSRIERGATYTEALHDAQQAGFAEADPSRDLAGLDAADKIAVLSWLGFGIDPTALAVRLRPLPEQLEDAVVAAARQGKRIRVVATARRLDGEVYAHVEPTWLPIESPFARAIDEENVVQVTTESAGVLTLSGRGAGGPATASAVLADLIGSARPVPAAISQLTLQ